MEFDEIVVKESPGLCRCCLSEGCYKDMSSEYNWMNDNEVYADMLLECFDISITQHTEGPNGPNRLICEVCITRLRDACNFKKQVLDSEMKFIDMMGRGEFRPKMVVYQTQTKVEDYVEEPENEGNEVEYLEDDITFTDDAEDLKDDPEPTVSDITVSSLRIKGKRGRPRKTEVKPEKKTKVAKIQEKPKSSKTVAKEKLLEHKMLEERRKEDLITLLTVIIQSTTITPFRWHKSKYMCFYCRSLFIESSKLKHHTDLEHQEVQLEEIVVRTLYRKGKIKLEVSDIWCFRCETQFDTLLEYFEHLPIIHEIFLDKDILKSFECFHLGDNGMSCLDCGQNFRFFGPLLNHRRKYHTEHFLCEICGQGFVEKHNVVQHVKQIHCVKSCKHCNQTFPTQYSLVTHVENVHRKDKLKCPLCPDILGNRYLKKRHLALVHDCKSAQIVCELCSKIFTRHNKYVQHKANVHFKEKNCTCEICGHKAFNIEALRRHLVCHDESRPFSCTVCDKSFRRKKTLLMHMRTHRVDEVVIITDGANDCE